MATKVWVRFPTAWVGNGGLKKFRWEREIGANNVAALMTLLVLGHHSNEEGISILTYDKLGAATGLSRPKISAGLNVLETNELVRRKCHGRSHYELINYAEKPWGKLPIKGLYSRGELLAFRDFHLRRRTELDAMKLYFLIVARRNNATNIANMNYNTINHYSGVERNYIKSATSFLAALGLMYVERLPSELSGYGSANGYRLVGLEPYIHMGTKGRGMDAYDFTE